MLVGLLAALNVAVASRGAEQTVPAAAELAGRVDRHYNALRSLRVDFVQQFDGMGTHRRESGALLLKKPGRMRWTYSEPAGKLFVLDGRNGYFYSPGATEVQRVPAKKLDDLRSPLRFLLGHTQLTRELLNLTAAPASTPGDFVLAGTPKGMEQRILAFKLTVSAGGVIHSIVIDETDGAETRFSFSNEQPDVSAASSDFVFNPPPGVNVIDAPPPM